MRRSEVNITLLAHILSDRVKGKEKAYVLFYATWCPFSRRFQPIFQEYAKKNPEERLSIIVDEDPDACEDYLRKYYLIVIMFKKGKVLSARIENKESAWTKRQLKDLTEKE